MVTSRLQLSVQAKKLSNVAGILHKSDPFAIVTVLGDDPSSRPEVLGRTEVIYNNLNPSWTTLFIIDNYHFSRPVYFDVGIFDYCHNSRDAASGATSAGAKPASSVNIYEEQPRHKCMGVARFEVGEILGSRGNMVSKLLKKGGVVSVHIERSVGGDKGDIVYQIRGLGLSNTQSEMLNKKSNPFYEIYRKEDRPTGSTWNNIFRSHVIKSNLNPFWDKATMDLERFCNGDLDRSIKISVWDYRKSGKHKLMGEFETSVRRFIDAKSKRGNADLELAFTLRKDGKKVGGIVVLEAQVVERRKSEKLEEDNRSLSSRPHEGLTVRPQFVDYLSGGCEISLSVAIDFTASNGNPTVKGTPHYVSPPNGSTPPKLNDYEKAIEGVGSILANFDSNKKFPVWGFGANIGGAVNHCFQVGPQTEVEGVDGMLEAYRGMFKKPLKMSFPTVFTEVVRTAAGYALHAELMAQQQGRLAYSVLLILTVGNVSDIEATKMELLNASAAPLSVVIVGIGDADFSGMQFLDDHDPTIDPGRDITQFVKFNEHHSVYSLTEAVLEEIPDQLVDYFLGKGILPGDAEQGDSGSIPVQPADEREEITRFMSELNLFD